MNSLAQLTKKLAIGFVASSCAFLNVANGATSQLTVDPPTIVTQVILLESCPLQSSKVQSFFGSIAAILLPSLVEAGIKGVGAAIKKAGEEKSFSVEASSSGNFYAYDEINSSFIANPAIQCLVIAYGRIGGSQAPDLASKEPFSNDPKRLTELTGLTDIPKFYAEFLIVPSTDRSAFAILPQLIFRKGKLSTSRELKETVLTVSFSTPSSSGSGSTFALYSTKFKDSYEDGVYLGAAQLLSTYASPFMPIPAIPATTSSALTTLHAQKGQLQTMEQQLIELDKKEDPLIEEINTEILDLERLKNSEIHRAEIALRDAVVSGEDQDIIRRLSTALEQAQRNADLEAQITKKKQELTERRKMLSSTVQRSNLADSVAKLKKNISFSRQIIAQTSPVNISATITETTSANKYLVTLGSLLEGKASEITKAISDEVTGAADKKEVADEIQNLTNINNLMLAAM
jgi:hypothetical protein